MVLNRTVWVFIGRELTHEENKALTDFIVNSNNYLEIKQAMHDGNGPEYQGGRILAVKCFDQKNRKFVVFKHLFRSNVHQSTSFFGQFSTEGDIRGQVHVVIACDEPQQFSFIRGGLT